MLPSLRISRGQNMTRDGAYTILTDLIKNQNLVKHHLATEAVMRALARHFNEDEEKWSLVGLLHDADYELTKDNPEKHTLVLEEKIGSSLEPDVMRAIKSHNAEYSGVEPQSKMDWAIYTCDELTGLIIAAALIHPDKKLNSIDADFILRRFDQPAFARGADRTHITPCEEKLGMPLKEFTELGLKAMQEISGGLGL